MKPGRYSRQNGTDLIRSEILISLILGSLLAAAFYGFVLVVMRFDPESYFAAMFMERGPIPVVTTLLAGTGLFLIGFSFIRLRRGERTFGGIQTVLRGVGPLDRVTAAGALDPVEKVGREHRGFMVAGRFVRALRRVADGLRRRSALAEVLREQSEIEHAILQNTTNENY